MCTEQVPYLLDFLQNYAAVQNSVYKSDPLNNYETFERFSLNLV